LRSRCAKRLARVVLAALPLSLCALTASCGKSSIAAEIVDFQRPKGSLKVGSPASTSISIENTGDEERAFSVGYSVRDPSGEWHDVLPGTVELTPGHQTTTHELRTNPLEIPGYYDSRISVWSEEPGDGSEAMRLADFQESSTFRVSSSREDFSASELDAGQWKATNRNLGRGELAPENAGIEEGLFRLALPANTLNGGEIKSTDLYGPGFYAARIKVPDAPSSITGFFLYEPPDLESEIDIEIYNDSSGKILFTTYANGEQTHTETMSLPFDPTDDFHDYAFFYDENSISFYVDGEPMQEFEGGLPEKRMKLYVNTWFPTWLDGEEPDSDRYAYMDWIER
jgi:hypothetical protein